jgi:hypothetical protein
VRPHCSHRAFRRKEVLRVQTYAAATRADRIGNYPLRQGRCLTLIRPVRGGGWGDNWSRRRR